MWFEFCFTWLEEWLETEILVCPCRNDVGFSAWVYFHSVLLPVDLDGHHSARIFTLIFCKVLVGHSIGFFHLEINRRTNFSQMSFFATKMALRALHQPACDTFSLQYLQISIGFFVCFLKSFPPRWWLLCLRSLDMVTTPMVWVSEWRVLIFNKSNPFYASSSNWAVESSLARSIPKKYLTYLQNIFGLSTIRYLQAESRS